MQKRRGAQAFAPPWESCLLTSYLIPSYLMFELDSIWFSNLICIGMRLIFKGLGSEGINQKRRRPLWIFVALLRNKIQISTSYLSAPHLFPDATRVRKKRKGKEILAPSLLDANRNPLLLLFLMHEGVHANCWCYPLLDSWEERRRRSKEEDLAKGATTPVDSMLLIELVLCRYS